MQFVYYRHIFATATMESLLVDCVTRNLGQFLFRNAIFVCERLCAEFPSEVNLQLLAGCYLHNNQAHCAYHVLKGTKMAQSRYLFALSCFQMDLLTEAESALFPVDNPTPEANVPNGASGHYLLGLVYRYTDRRENAIRHFKRALSIDPLLWAAYEELCVLGHTEGVGEYFGESAALCIQKQLLTHELGFHQLRTSFESSSSVSTNSFSVVDTSPHQLKQVQPNNRKESSKDSHGIINGGSANTFYTTPSPVVTRLPAVNPPPLVRNMQAHHPVYIDADFPPRLNSTTQPPRRKFVDEGKLRKISGRLFYDSGLRRSSRLAGESASSTSVNSLTGNGSSHSSKWAGNTKLNSITLRHVSVRKGNSCTSGSVDQGTQMGDDSRKNNSVTNTCSSPHSDSEQCEHGPDLPMDGLRISGGDLKSSTAICDVLSLFRSLGEAYRHSCMYRSQEALDAYMNLSPKQYNTAWVLCQVGKAYFEMINYLEAERAFSLARLASPCNMEGMDIYSTVLYHLKEDMKLSYLSQELISIDRLAPQTWCAAGNCYSLQKDHVTALKIFVRAVQLNSRFTYAHTLCGHEHVAMEEYEKGIKCYRSALKTDGRHYNAWYGLGMVYLRQEKFEFAEHHFRTACRINPYSSVILSYLGTALHSLKRSGEAMKVMERAIKADGKNPLPKYEKASILAGTGREEEAVRVLEELKESAPRECSVYALLGTLYSRLNLLPPALLHLGLALDLNPPLSDLSKIKALIDSLNSPDTDPSHHHHIPDD